MQNIVLKEDLECRITPHIRSVLPWHVFAIINISGFRKKDRGQANLFGSIHEVNNVVSVLEVKSSPTPTRLVRVKDSPKESGCKSP